MPLFEVLPDELESHIVGFLKNHEQTLTRIAKTCRSGRQNVEEIRASFLSQAQQALEALLIQPGESEKQTFIAILNDALTNNRLYILRFILEKYQEDPDLFEQITFTSTLNFIQFFQQEYDVRIKQLAHEGEKNEFKKYTSLQFLYQKSMYAAFYAVPDLAMGLLKNKNFAEFEKTLAEHPAPNPILLHCCEEYEKLPPGLFHVDIAFRLIATFHTNHPKTHFYGRIQIKKLLDRIDQTNQPSDYQEVTCEPRL